MIVSMFRGSVRLTLTCIALATMLAGCAHHGHAQTGSTRPSPTGALPHSPTSFAPTPGTEQDFFRTVDVYLTVDFEKGTIDVFPHDPHCQEGDRDNPNCNVVEFEIPKSYGKKPDQEVIADFMKMQAGGEVATETHRVPRIFYPPTSTAKSSELARLGCRPDFPARQIRWIAVCPEGQDDCMKSGDQIVIRPKGSRPRGFECREIPYHSIDFRLLDLLADAGGEQFAQYKCLQDFSAPNMAKRPSAKAASAELSYYFQQDGFHDFARGGHGAFFAEKRRVDVRQRERLYSPQTRGFFSISTACPPETVRECPGCCQGSVKSGVPFEPKFVKPLAGIMWSYAIELWRGNECVVTLDPDGWTEDDSGPGG